MLTMEQVYRIRNMRNFEGKSLRKISQLTGHDFETVKKYVEKDDFNHTIRPKQRRKSKLSPYRSIVKTWLIKDKQAPHKQQHTAKRVYDRLTELYGDEFNASERAVRKFVADIRKELQTNTEGFLPLEHPPGEAQADFGEARFVENGITYDGYYLNLSYPHSNGGHMQLFKSANQECLLEGMKAIFEHIGGVPTAIWFDNMSTVVKKIKEYGERDLTKGFLRFMMHYGFRSNFCNPDSGHEKGSVENKVGYHLYLHEFAKADNYEKIKFDGRVYSTSPNMARQQVIVKAGAFDVEILDEDCNHIIKHRRLYGEEKESMNWIPYLELMSKRPTALKYTGLYNQLPQILKDYLDKNDYEGKKQALKLFAKMTAITGLNSAIEAFEEGLKLGVSDADSIWATYCRLTSGTLPEPEVSLPDTVPELKRYSPDIKIYDQLIIPGGMQL
jgi:transposase